MKLLLKVDKVSVKYELNIVMFKEQEEIQVKDNR